jgi:hypothetical protein
MTFDRALIARCGDYCGICAWKEPMNCPGCQAARGDMFHGVCQVAKCSLAKGYAHCGECPDLPCGMLQAISDDPEHGDNGERLANLRAWERGEERYIAIGTFGDKGSDVLPSSAEVDG